MIVVRYVISRCGKTLEYQVFCQDRTAACFISYELADMAATLYHVRAAVWRRRALNVSRFLVVRAAVRTKMGMKLMMRDVMSTSNWSDYWPHDVLFALGTTGDVCSAPRQVKSTASRFTTSCSCSPTPDVHTPSSLVKHIHTYIRCLVNRATYGCEQGPHRPRLLPPRSSCHRLRHTANLHVDSNLPRNWQSGQYSFSRVRTLRP